MQGIPERLGGGGSGDEDKSGKGQTPRGLLGKSEGPGRNAMRQLTGGSGAEPVQCGIPLEPHRQPSWL